MRDKASKPPWPDDAENADDDQIKRDDIVQKRGPQEDQHAGQDGNDGLQGNIVHEGDPQVGARLIEWRRNRGKLSPRLGSVNKHSNSNLKFGFGIREVACEFES